MKHIPFYKHMFDLLESIDECEAKNRTLPCLALLYTGMDVMASLESQRKESNQSSFVRWVDSYLLTGGSFDCTALELYAARCGVLHTFTPDSDLQRKGKVRRIGYAWGTADVAKLALSAQWLGHDVVSIHLRDLVRAFKEAVANQLEAISNDSVKEEEFVQKAGLWFSELGCTAVDDLLAFMERDDVPSV